jgi:Cu/Zn superoxide dismutase
VSGGRVRITPAGLAMALGAAVLAGCSMMKSPAEPSSQVQVTPPAPLGMEARVRALGSGVSGKIRVIDRGDGVTLLVSLINLPEGPYRIALHATPNCSSPNGFSAGPPWAPAGAGKPARDRVPVFATKAEGTAEASVHLRGVHVSGPDGVGGHSVVVYSGSRVTDAVPDVPNNRVACGVFEPSQSFQF